MCRGGRRPPRVGSRRSEPLLLPKKDPRHRRWFKYATDPGSPLPAPERARLRLRFAVSARGGASGDAVEEEAAQHGDMMLLDAEEGYENLWRKVGLGAAAGRRPHRRRRGSQRACGREAYAHTCAHARAGRLAAKKTRRKKGTHAPMHARACTPLPTHLKPTHM